MPTLKFIPPPVASADELMAMAHAMEKEAARRYRELAARMRLRDDPDLARLFEFLASIEEKHAVQVAERAADRLGARIEPTRIAWEVPENFDEEEGSSRLLTRYRALAVAVRNEERAFAFFSYVAAAASDARIRELAEELAKDELAHAGLLRRERRLAWRDAHGLRAPAAELPETMAELWRLVAETEWRAARHHRALAAKLASGAAAAALLSAAEEEAARARDAAGRVGIQLDEAPETEEPTIDDALRLLELAFERYADIAERTRDETVLRHAQLLEDAALRRLALVRGSLGNALFEGAATPLPGA